MTTEFDASILQRFADQLYSKADTIVVLCVFFWGFVGLAGGGFLGVRMAGAKDGAILGMAMGSLLGGFIGYAIGTARAFKLRLLAQQTLCQMAIERNTQLKP